MPLVSLMSLLSHRIALCFRSGELIQLIMMCYFCSDMDECELGLDNCHPNATCSDVEGGFECFCNIGFEGDGTTCISECGLTSVFLCFQKKLVLAKRLRFDKRIL